VTLRRFVQHPVALSQLTCVDATITLPIPEHDEQQNLYAAFQLCITTPILYSITIEQCFDPSTAGYVGPATLSIRRVIHRIGHIWPKLPHALPRPF
jgi:hypothetical protein